MRIQVTGFLHTGDLPDDCVDVSHPTGLSEHGYLTGVAHLQLTELDDVTYELVTDDDEEPS